MTGYRHYSECTPSPAWRDDYGELMAYRRRMYSQLLPLQAAVAAAQGAARDLGPRDRPLRDEDGDVAVQAGQAVRPALLPIPLSDSRRATVTTGVAGQPLGAARGRSRRDRQARAVEQAHLHRPGAAGGSRADRQRLLAAGWSRRAFRGVSAGLGELRDERVARRQLRIGIIPSRAHGRRPWAGCRRVVVYRGVRGAGPGRAGARGDACRRRSSPPRSSFSSAPSSTTCGPLRAKERVHLDIIVGGRQQSPASALGWFMASRRRRCRRSACSHILVRRRLPDGHQAARRVPLSGGAAGAGAGRHATASRSMATTRPACC